MNAVWVVSDGNPGHYNQSRAVAEAVAEARGWPVEWVVVRPRYRGVLRPLVYGMINALAGRFGLPLARRLFVIDTLPTSRPAMVISSGGSTAVFNVLAACEYGSPNLFLGRPPLRFDRFSRILLSEEAGEEPNAVHLPFLPTPVTPTTAAEAGASLRKEIGVEDGARLWALLIGGRSRSHRYTEDDWSALAAAMNTLSARYGGQWLITSSRRTGKAAERILRETLHPGSVADATWWSDRPRAVVAAYLGGSELAFCTQDSLTMLTDSMAAARPVFALQPNDVIFDAGADMFRCYLEDHETAGRIRRLPIADLGTLDLDHVTDFRPVRESIKHQIYEGYVRDLLDETI